MEHVLNGLMTNLEPGHLLTLVLGTAVGMVIGAMPGLSAVTGVALMLPFSFSMEPAQGLIMLAAVYAAAEVAGAIPAIMINAPGTSGAACTMLDGFPMSQKGETTEALYLQLYAGVVGGLVGGVALLFFTPQLARWSLLLGPPEYFWLAIAGLALVAGLSGKHVLKGLVAVTLGVLLTIPGQDGITGDMRFTFDYYRAISGIPFVPALLGLFAVASVLDLLSRAGERIAPLNMRKGTARYVLRRVWGMKKVLGWTSLVGTLVGSLPGAGASASAFVAYGEAKRLSKHPEEFGKGSWEGVAAPEAANNAVVPGAMIPLLGLGIPGSGSAAILYGALTVHGILAGPRLFTDRPEIAYTFIVGLMLTVPAILIFGLSTIRWSRLVVRAPVKFMVPAVLALAMIGTYGLNNSLYDVGILVGMGIVGYFLAKVGVAPVGIALGLVLGQLVEQSYQRSSILAGVQDMSVWLYFFTRPVALLLMLVAAAVLVTGLRQVFRAEPVPVAPEVPSSQEAASDAQTGVGEKK